MPIVVAPLNDLLSLAITEGIEDALSVYEASGLGVWAAGSAPHMAKLAAAVARAIHMREAFELLDAWGFEPKTILTWAKDKMGMGDWLRGKTEPPTYSAATVTTTSGIATAMRHRRILWTFPRACGGRDDGFDGNSVHGGRGADSGERGDRDDRGIRAGIRAG
jgi:hypothetical protein